MKPIWGFILLAALLSGPLILSAQPAGDRHSPHRIHRNNFEVFLGGTWFPKAQRTLFTLGLDYEHRSDLWHRRLGVGVLIDYEFRNGDQPGSFLLTPTAILFPAGDYFKVFAGLGPVWEGERLMVLGRAGLGYEFEIGKYLVLAPTLSVDLTPAYTAWVGGMAVGAGF